MKKRQNQIALYIKHENHQRQYSGSLQKLFFSAITQPFYFCTHLLWALPPPQLGEHMIYYQEENILRVKVTAIDLVQETVCEMGLSATCVCSYPIHALLVGLGLEPR